MKLVLIPAGTFTMGAPYEEEGAGEDETPHQVTISKEYYLGKYEVTQGQYEEIMNTNPSRSTRRVIRTSDVSMYPVERVTWEEAVEFCKKLSELPKEKAARRVYRLPTEAEWEHACRAGSKTAYSFGNTAEKLSSYATPSALPSHRVGQKKPNAWGLFDMYGSMTEWCQDWYGDYHELAVTDPRGPQKGSFRVSRGAGRSAMRTRRGVDTRSPTLGFRVAGEQLRE